MPASQIYKAGEQHKDDGAHLLKEKEMKMAFIHRPERKNQMSVSATEKDTSLLLLLKGSTGKCWKQRK